jgi:hypothetical protein
MSYTSEASSDATSPAESTPIMTRSRSRHLTDAAEIQEIATEDGELGAIGAASGGASASPPARHECRHTAALKAHWTTKLWASDRRKNLRAYEAVLDVDKQCQAGLSMLKEAEYAAKKRRAEVLEVEARVCDSHQSYEAARAALPRSARHECRHTAALGIVWTAKLWANDRQQLMRAEEAVLDADKQCLAVHFMLQKAQDAFNRIYAEAVCELDSSQSHKVLLTATKSAYPSGAAADSKRPKVTKSY